MPNIKLMESGLPVAPLKIGALEFMPANLVKR